MNVKIISVIFGGLVSMSSVADGYGPYNQQQTYNYNTGCSNWQSCFGPGINTAAVTLIGGLVNAMSRPDPVQYQQQQQQPIYVNGNSSYNQQPQYNQQQYVQNNCRMQTLYDQSGNPRNVKVCE